MFDSIRIPPLVIALLAIWRITHLLGREDGPFGVLRRFRDALGRGEASQLVHCFYCLSLWVALPFAWMLASTGWVEGALLWFGLSGGAILLERVTERTDSNPTPAAWREEPPADNPAAVEVREKERANHVLLR